MTELLRCRQPSARAGGVLVAVGAALIATGAASAGATSPGGNGVIAFVHREQIVTARNVGAQLQYRYLTTSGDNRGPRWSPNGTRLVFATAPGTVTVMSANGTGRRTLVASGAAMPAWQTNARIAYVKPATGKGDIYSIPAGGGAATRVTVDGAKGCGNRNPAFSFDGRYLAYIHVPTTAGACPTREASAQLKVVDRTTGATRVVASVAWPGPGSDLAVLPERVDFDASGRRVMFRVQDTDTTQVWPLLDVQTGAYTFSTEEVWCDWDCSYVENAPLPDGRFAKDVYDTNFLSDLDVQPVRS